MSIKGIDTQMMVARTTEYTKDSSNQLKKNELMHDFLAGQSELAEAIEQKKVMKSAEAEQATLHLDSDGSSSFTGEQSRDGRAGSGNQNEEDDEYVGPFVPPGASVIDIKV